MLFLGPFSADRESSDDGQVFKNFMFFFLRKFSVRIFFDGFIDQSFKHSHLGDVFSSDFESRKNSLRFFNESFFTVLLDLARCDDNGCARAREGGKSNGHEDAIFKG